MSSLISSQCKNLESLWISVDGYGGIQPARPRPMLEPYEAFHQLSLTLADNDFQDMVKAWPSLEAFHLLHDRLNTSVRYMGVYTFPISESDDVATYLSILTPYLMTVCVKTGCGYRSEWFWEACHEVELVGDDGTLSSIMILNMVTIIRAMAQSGLGCIVGTGSKVQEGRG
ncbi:hypothetical protein F5141DRAFT_1065964 [Pisolithus sp. B1]|nr:hypothetical protein F5141DRAFT_1065964 [Pisolithus sp. B1]